MPTKTSPEFVVIPTDARVVMRETRTHLGLSRATVEKRAKVGTDYLKRLEGGRQQHVDAARLRRVLQVLQQAAARGQVPATLTARLARLGKAVAKEGQPPARR
jgi:predicted transcriptional regulator